jgi:hypothetical protein
LIALIDIEKEGRRLGLFELAVAPFGGIEQVAQRSLALEQQLDGT